MYQMTSIPSPSVYQFEYFLNKTTGKWAPYKSKGALNPVMLMSNDQAWCDYHSRIEPVSWDKTGAIHFQCGRNGFVPAMLQNEKGISSILFTVDIKNLKLDVSFKICKPFFAHAKKYLDKSSLTSHFDLQSGEVSIEHQKKGEIYFDNNFDIENVPQFIQDAIQNSLTQLTTRIYGFPCKNTYVKCQAGFKHFVLYPACPPISNLKSEFRIPVNRNSTHPFEDLCALHNIKPAKSFRKKFIDNSSVFLVNVFFKQLGFDDSNIFNKYYENAVLIYLLETDFYCIYEKSYKSNPLPKVKYIYYEDGLLQSMALFVREQSKKTSQSVIASRLLDPLLNYTTTIDIYKDCAQIFYNNCINLPEPVKKRVLKEGFTDNIHNRLCEVIGRTRANPWAYGNHLDNKVIKYTEKELELEQLMERRIGGTDENPIIQKLEFELPKDTDGLYLISDKMRNCVGYCYRDRVVNRNCTIITVENKKIHKGVACIELNGRNIVQALGPCNCRIEKKYIKSIQIWMKLHHLTSSVKDLNEERIIETDFSESEVCEE